MESRFLIYLLAMAGVTYLIRMLPLLLVRKKIENRFIVSFLYYLPSAVLSVMTVPAVFYIADNKISAILGFLTAVIFSYFGKSLMKVAVIACIVVFITELIIKMTVF